MKKQILFLLLLTLHTTVKATRTYPDQPTQKGSRETREQTAERRNQAEVVKMQKALAAKHRLEKLEEEEEALRRASQLAPETRKAASEALKPGFYKKNQKKYPIPKSAQTSAKKAAPATQRHFGTQRMLGCPICIFTSRNPNEMSTHAKGHSRWSLSHKKK